MLHVKIDPPGAGRLWLDGQTFSPRIPYDPGEVVEIMVLPDDEHLFAGWDGDVLDDRRWEMPLRLTVTAADQHLVARMRPGDPEARPPEFDSAFENGNGTPRYIYPLSNKVVFEPEQRRGADNIWWRFRLSGLTPGDCVQIWPLSSGYGDADDIVWAGDCNPVYSYDGETWYRFTGVRPPYLQRFEAASVEISRNIPYDSSQVMRLRQETHAPEHGVVVRQLCQSEGGRPVPMWQFGANKPIILIMARQHAFESHASWYAEGVIRWLASGDPEAVALREKATVCVVPIMDVDNVAEGGSGKEQLDASGQRADFNRAWGEPSPWRAIRSAKDILAENQVLAVIDLHDPWYPRPSYWGYDADLAPRVEPFASLWSACLRKANATAKWRHDLRAYARSGSHEGSPSSGSREPTQGRLTSLAWSRLYTDSGGVLPLILLIETSHWRDGYGSFITKETLLAYGHALGMALARTAW